jgi:hypothetical protein
LQERLAEAQKELGTSDLEMEMEMEMEMVKVA